MDWYNEFRGFCPSVPCILVGNKIDSKINQIKYNLVDKKSTERRYDLAEKMSAADGTNVVRVRFIHFISLLTSQIFNQLLQDGMLYKINPKVEMYDKILDLLDCVMIVFVIN